MPPSIGVARMPKRARPPVADRNRQLGRIHAGKKALRLDDDTYRALLERITGYRSAAFLSDRHRTAVLAEMGRLGFKADAQQARKRVFAGTPKHVKEVPLLRKIEALLADSKRPWAYAHAMAKQMFGRDRLEFCRPDELHKLAAALQVDANRRGTGNCETAFHSARSSRPAVPAPDSDPAGPAGPRELE